MLVFRSNAKSVHSTSVLLRIGFVNFRRFKSTGPGNTGDSSNEKDSQNSNDKSNKNDDLIAQDKRDVTSFKIRSTSSPSAPAPIDAQDTGLDHLVKKNNKPYIPKLKHDRVTFEYPGLPNEDDFAKAQQPKTATRWSRYVPKILTALAIVWGAYTVKVWIYATEKGADSKELLDPSEFHKFIVTHKEDIDDDHYLIELLPKYSKWQYSYSLNYESKSIWNGDRIWSVDVKQPDIMVVRAYTPLPLYFLKSEYTRSGEKKPLLKVINNDGEDYDKGGVMCLYVKKYNDGEISRYITSKNIGDEIELRGPNVEYRFPYHPLKNHHTRPIFRDIPSKIDPEHLLQKTIKVNDLPAFDNMNYFAAGTGIAPILQVLFSRNPYRGFVNIHYSAQKHGELEPFERFLFFLEKLDRIKLIRHYDSENMTKLTAKDVPKPSKSAYTSPLKLEQNAAKLTPEEALRLRISILEGEEPAVQNKKLNEERAPRYLNAIQQAIVTSEEQKENPTLSLVCGPEGYISYVAGPKDLNNNQQGQVGGLLGEKEWDESNTYKL